MARSQAARNGEMSLAKWVLSLLLVVGAALLVGKAVQPLAHTALQRPFSPGPQMSKAHAGRAKSEPALEELPRLAPEQLTAWRAFAVERGCSLDDREYEQIFRQLAPFHRRGGISEGEVEKVYAEMEPYMGGEDDHGVSLVLYKIRNGTLAERRAAPSPTGLTEHRTYFDGLLQLPGVLPNIPDVTFVLNRLDQPRSWTAELPPEDEAALREGRLSVGEAFERHACDSAGLAGMKRMHGMLGSRAMLAWRRGLFPIFSMFTIPNCFGDILVPYPVGDRANKIALNSGCPVHGDWASKVPKAFWRGTTTGAIVDGKYPDEDWRLFQRQRLVEYSRNHSDAIDAGFTGFTQCASQQCKEMEAHFGRAGSAIYEDLIRYKYQMIVDGNAAVGRLAPALCSGSLVLIAQVVRQWFYFKLKPYTHFVPIKLDYSDLAEKVEWARQHDAEAQRIAAAAAELVNMRMRQADEYCYTYRALLEYAAIFKPARLKPA